MDVRRLDLGVIADVHAETFGEPGQRTFRLLIQPENGRISLWLEKEQIVALLSAVEEILQRVPANRGHEPAWEVDQSLAGDLETRVGSLAVGFDGERGGFSLEVSDFAQELGITHMALLLSRQTFESLGDELRTIVQGSRPRCPMCGAPLSGEPHFCPESNGHAHLNSGE